MEYGNIVNNRILTFVRFELLIESSNTYLFVYMYTRIHVNMCKVISFVWNVQFSFYKKIPESTCLFNATRTRTRIQADLNVKVKVSAGQFCLSHRIGCAEREAHVKKIMDYALLKNEEHT